MLIICSGYKIGTDFDNDEYYEDFEKHINSNQKINIINKKIIIFAICGVLVTIATLCFRFL